MGAGKFSEVTAGAFARPEAVLTAIDDLSESPESATLLIYYIGHARWTARAGLALAQPSSSHRLSSYIRAEDLLTHALKAWRRVVLVVDAPYEHAHDVPAPPAGCAIIGRRMGPSATSWPAGGDAFSGCFAETIELASQALPTLSVQELRDIVAFRLGAPGAHVATLVGAEAILREPFLVNSDPSLAWRIEQDNLASPDRGSREDGVQALLEFVNQPDHRRATQFILEKVAATDPAPEVRRAARAARRASIGSTAQRIRHTARFGQTDRLPWPTWCHVPRGEFLMGSDPQRDGDALHEELPQEHLYLESFDIGRSPVSRADWLRFMNATGHPRPSGLTRAKMISTHDLPVTGVSWYEACAFAEWLTADGHRTGDLAIDSLIRLPTEAEWEKAARGPKGLIYPWGNEFEANRCNCRSTGIGSVVRPGTFSPQGDSPYGLADMAGNVWEWTCSLWGRGGHSPEFAYPYDPGDGRENPDEGPEVRRVIRGGAFYYFDNCVRCATRNVMYPHVRHSGGGFRLVRVARALSRVPTLPYA